MRRLLLLAGLLLLWISPAYALDPWAGCQFLFAGAGISITCPDTVTGGATITSTGSSAALDTIKFWLGKSDATVPAGLNLGALTSGLVLNSVAAGTGTPSAYAGTACGVLEAIQTLDGSGAAVCIPVGGGIGSGVKFWVAKADASVPNAKDLGALTTGLVLNTVAAATGTPSTYAGATCGAGNFVSALDASGAATCSVPAGTGAPTTAHYVTTQAESGLSAEFSLGSLTTGLLLNTVAASVGTPSAYAGTSCTNQFLTALNASASGTCTTATLASAQFANQGTTTTVLHGNAAGNPSFAAVTGSDMTNNTVTATQLAVVQTRRVCTMIIGSDNGAVLADGDLGPQGRQCFIPAAATVVEVNVSADGGTPNVIPRRNRAGSGANFVSGALATAAAGAIACSNTGGTTGLDGATTCTNTLQNTSLNAGDYIELISGTAGGVAKRMSIFVIYTIN